MQALVNALGRLELTLVDRQYILLVIIINFIIFMYGFLLLCCSNVVRQKCRDLENQVRGPSRAMKMSPFDRKPMTSY